MENASKALIIAGSVLITVMIIAVAVYLFGQGKNLANSTSSRASEIDIQSFNAQFSSYQTTWAYGSEFNGDDLRYQAPSSLKTISDVVSAVNLATSVNSQNNYGYNRENYVETTNAVEVIIDMTLKRPSTLERYYLIEPNKEVKVNCIYAFNSLPSLELNENARTSRIKNFSNANEKNCNTLLQELNETKLKSYNNSNYTLYKYYFTGEYSTSSVTGKINSLKFTLVYDSGFDNL